MTPERWQRIEAVVQAALEREASQRAAFLDAACAGDPALREEVESLLAQQEPAAGFMETPAVETTAAWRPEGSAEAWIGRRLGPYEIQQEIGRGGMGAVYRAVRADDAYQKHVAIKLAQHGMGTDALRRFRKERQILANLDHPHIAKLLDGGATEDGLSYLVMDYIEGLPIDEYCDTHQLSTRARLELFRTVCSAVHYAHERGVVHRDLKPGNILVTAEGVPKLLDFGIAKLLHAEVFSPTGESTVTGLRPMTPEYASPEQVRGAVITPASDIYSLGVLLYKLLTGQHPYGVRSHAAQEIERAICEKEPEKPSAAVLKDSGQWTAGESEPRRTENGERKRRSPLSLLRPPPSSVKKALVGDLDNIVLMALRKEPERRYVSVEQFSEDIRRHLQGLPVLARKDTLAYRSAKFLRRNPAGVLAGAVIALLVLALLAMGVYLLPGRVPGRDNGIQSLAVLPLQNLSGDPAQEYFADGMTEALIRNLTQIGTLRVIARTSVMPYKTDRPPLPEIARRLGVDAVVEGTVWRSESRVRMAVQVMQPTTGHRLWAKDYEGDPQDIPALQSEAAQAIAREIRVKLTPQEQARLSSTQSTRRDVYEAYLKGRYFWDQETEAGLQKSLEYFHQAIEKDPNYALAYAGLADAHSLLNALGFRAPQESFPPAKAAALRALEIDAQLGEAHNSLGAIKASYDWDFVGAEKEFQRAIALNPGYALAHSWYAQILSAMGRHEMALSEDKQSNALDPLNNTLLDRTFFLARQYDAALEQSRKVLEVRPRTITARARLGLAYEQKGMYDEAIAELQQALALSGESAKIMAWLGHAYARAGQTAKAQSIAKKLERRSEQQYVSPYFIAQIYTGLGDKDRAFKWLRRGYEERASNMIWLATEPTFDSLRSDPRFADLLRRIGLPP